MRCVRALRFLALSLTAVALTAGSVSASAPGKQCTCRHRDGAKYELGQTACIRIGDLSYLARCEMNLNVTTWKRLRDGCPTAGLAVTIVPSAPIP